MKKSEKKSTSCIKRSRLMKMFTKPSMTKQSHKDECDVNNILKKYSQTGVITHSNSKQGTYGNFADAQDYQSSLNSLMTAQDNFDNLPAQIRDRFKNDPYELLTFLDNPANKDEAIKLNLLKGNKNSNFSNSKSAKVDGTSAEQTSGSASDLDH